MKKLLLFLFLVPSLSADNQDKNAYAKNNAWVYHPYERLMSLSDYPNAIVWTNSVLQYDGMQLWLLGKKLYEQYNPSVLKPEASLKIPKIIHQIWVGSECPVVFHKYMNTWKKYHPDWEYILWTDEKIATELYPLVNQKFYDETNNMGVKSDIARYEIIYRYGGLYVDMDFEALRSLELLHYTYDFYSAFQPLDAFFVQLGVALFAAWPGHPTVKHCIDTIKDDWHEKGAPKKSGPVHFSKSILATAGQNNRKDIVFPAFYMYPLGCTQKELKYEEWIAQGAYAVHHWAKSWMPKETRRSEFRTFDNEQSSKVWND